MLDDKYYIENFDEFTPAELRARERLQKKFKHKQLIGRSFNEAMKLKELQDKLRTDDRETRIIAALELVSICGNLFDELCKIRFKVNPTWENIRILNELIYDVKEYLDSKGIQAMGVYTIVVNYGRMVLDQDE